MLRQVDELESIGDSCFNLARTLRRKRENCPQAFTTDQIRHITEMMSLTDTSLSNMQIILEQDGELREDQSLYSHNLENEINNYRSQLKNQNIIDINNQKYDYQLGVFYMDLIAECEKLGDYVINVVEARTGKKQQNA